MSFLFSSPERKKKVFCDEKTPVMMIINRHRRSNFLYCFKAKTKCIPLCVPGSSFTHKVTNSEIIGKTSVFITSPKGLSSGKEHHHTTGR
jgi:hypothetical protein